MIEKIIKYPKAKLIAILIIIVLHTVGLIGIGILKNGNIITLTWVNLTVTFCIGLLFFEARFRHLIWPLLLAVIIGIVTEGIGVNTGYLFGDYKYGTLLGFKIYNVPFTIGLLWAGLNVAAKNFAGRITNRPVFIAVFAAVLMVIFDVVMEPVAMALNFWAWDQNTIPIFNYLSWFFVSLLIQVLWMKVNTNNKVFDSIFIIQILFFVGLNIIL